jgi:hypothetical protein
MSKKMSWRGIEDAVTISKKDSFVEIAPHASVARNNRAYTIIAVI